MLWFDICCRTDSTQRAQRGKPERPMGRDPSAPSLFAFLRALCVDSFDLFFVCFVVELSPVQFDSSMLRMK